MPWTHFKSGKRQTRGADEASSADGDSGRKWHHSAGNCRQLNPKLLRNLQAGTEFPFLIRFKVLRITGIVPRFVSVRNMCIALR